MQKGSDLFRLNSPFSKKGELASMENIKTNLQFTFQMLQETNDQLQKQKKKTPHLLQSQAKTGSNLKVCCVINKESKTKTNVFLLNRSPIFQYLARPMVRGISPSNAVDETMNVHHRRSDHFLGNPPFLIF